MPSTPNTPNATKVELTRSVRFSIPFAAPGDDDGRLVGADRHNTFAGWPSVPGLAAHYEMHVRCAGRPDVTTGYVMNIARVDEAVRKHAIPIIERAVRNEPHAAAERILRAVLSVLAPALDNLVTSITWNLTPYYSVSMESAAMDRVVLRQQFSFAASHRLHCPELGDDENRRIFGRCNNPSGHGHNYRLEVAASVPLDTAADASAPPPARFTLHDLERIVDETVIRRFDHTHLNADTVEFSELNPSVEHIARVCFDLLMTPVAESGERLEPLTVWETDKTCCTYPAPGP